MDGYSEEVAVLSAPLDPPAMRDDQSRCYRNAFSCSFNARESGLVCVTGGNSYFGSALVKKLLARGYFVRVSIQNQEDFEDLKGQMREDEMNMLESVVVAKMGDLQCLCEVFRGCHAVFHTSSFIDPHGVTGYTEKMAFLETEGAKNVVEACARAAYVKRCIFTSSLLASIWINNDVDRILDEGCWSDEEFCRENKLWLALGKTMAERSAWRKSRELKVKLITVCPGLLMAPSFPDAHTETSLPYLKGGHLMLRRGTLATEDAERVAEVHVSAYEAMDYGACGRYLCFGRIIRSMEEAIQLENGLKMEGLFSRMGNQASEEADNEIPSRLSNAKVARLLLQASQHFTCRQ
ncbi:Cinnamoyl-CoA reductase [Bertholletia excelsa]